MRVKGPESQAQVSAGPADRVAFRGNLSAGAHGNVNCVAKCRARTHILRPLMSRECLEPSASDGVRGAGRRRTPGGWVAAVALLALLGLLAPLASAQQASISRFARFTGNIDIAVTGGSLRAQPNEGNACAVVPSSTRPLAGVPAGAQIVAAYLYWGGSGATVDGSVNLNGAPVAASRTFTSTFTLSGTDFPFFGGFADVTSRISGNGAVTFGGLAVNTGAPHCASQAVVAGWSLVVIYGAPGERLRAVNVFDGLQWFRGSALTLTPDGFRIPPAGIDGRMAVVTWEGDPVNSTPLNGFAEALRFNGVALDDGIVVPRSDPASQPFDGTINSISVADSWGVDVDLFDVSALLQPGQTSASAAFSAGGDLVLLTALVVSATSEPVVDLSLSKTAAGEFIVGSEGEYALRVSNAAGAQREDNVVTVTDTLPDGLSFVSGTGGAWACTAAGQEVRCDHPPPLDPGAALPELRLRVAVGAAAVGGVINTASVASASFDVGTANNSASAPTVVRGPDLSASTKDVVDLNGGEPDPGDTLRYTITLVETAGVAASGVRVTDELPAGTTGFAVVSLPAGAIDLSSATGGANGAGRLDIGGISVAPGGSATIVFDLRIAASLAPGSTIDNVASVENPAGPGALPAAPQLVVSPSRIPVSGIKQLYLRRGGPLALSRLPGSTAEGSEAVPGGGSRTWVLAPALQQPFTIRAGSVPVRLWLRRTGGGGGNRNLTVTLANSATGQVGSASLRVSPPAGSSPALFTFLIPNPGDRTFPAGSAITLTVAQTSGNAGSQTQVHSAGPGSPAASQVLFDSPTVINVDAVAVHDGQFPAGAAGGTFAPGSSAWLRATVSDPFGSFDIGAVRVSVTDPGGAVRLSSQPMPRVADSGAATATFELPFVVPADAVAGGWTVSVEAEEGTEGTVLDTGVAGFVVARPVPELRVQKTVQVVSDPENGGVAPRRIPGSLQVYTVSVWNDGPGPVDASSLVVTDAIPGDVVLYVGPSGGDAVEFIEGANPSGLTLGAADVTFSTQPGGGPPFGYLPVPDAEGFDPAVRGLRIAPQGSMNGSSSGTPPSFSLRFTVRVR